MCIQSYDSDGRLDLRLVPSPLVPDYLTLIANYWHSIDVTLTLEDTIEIEQSYSLAEQDLEQLLDLHDARALERINVDRTLYMLINCGYLN